MPKSSFKFISECEVANEIFKLKGEKRIAVAFWGSGSLEALGLSGTQSKKAKIICNLESGGTNPSVIKELYDAGGAYVKSNPRLHSKVYIIGSTVILGSSNASANGLALEGKELTSWIEANILTDDSVFVKKVDQWFTKQWEIADEISDSKIQDAYQQWNKMRQSTPYVSKATSIFDLSLEDIRDRQIYIAMYCQYASDAAQSAFKRVNNEVKQNTKLQKNSKTPLSFFEDWEELPCDAFIISVYVGSRGKVEFDKKVFKRIPALDREFKVNGDKFKIQVVEKK